MANEVEEMRCALERAELNLTRMRWILQNPVLARDCINRAMSKVNQLGTDARVGELGLVMLKEMDAERVRTGVR